MTLKLIPVVVSTATLLLAAAPVLHANDGLPPFSWDRVPVYAHVGKASDDFTPEELDFLAEHFDFITIEKGQAARKYGNTEEGFAAAAREIKKRNPDAKVLFYWKASLDPSTVRWGYKAARTFPADGHLKDSAGKPLFRRKTVPNYDLRRPDVRAWWSDAAAKAVREYGADGIFADAMGDPPVANQKTLEEQTVSDLRAARLALMEETRRKIGRGHLVVIQRADEGKPREAAACHRRRDRRAFRPLRQWLEQGTDCRGHRSGADRRSGRKDRTH